MTYKTLEESYKAKLHRNMKLIMICQGQIFYESNKLFTL